MKRNVIVFSIVILLIGSFFYWFTTTKRSQGMFSEVALGLPEAKQSELVTLKNGDSYNLTASFVKKIINGKEVKTISYNGSIPGPTFKIPQDATITVHFMNNTDIPTSLHSHGIRDKNQFDGVPDITQKAIPVGGTFTYKLTFPDPGVFWYHAHIREDYTQPLGLYGNYLVVPKDPKYYSPVNRDVNLTVSDMLFANGQIAPFDANTVDHTLMGRFGNTMLINGETNYKLDVKKGDVVRFYITNTANVRPFNLAIPGAKIKLIGGDNGKYENEQFVDSILIGPSERTIIEVLFDSYGTYYLLNKTPQISYKLATFTVSSAQVDASYGEEFNTLRKNQDTIASIDRLRQYFDKPFDKSLTLSLTMMDNQNNMQGMDMGNGGKNGMMSASNNNNTIEWEDTMGSMSMMSNSNMMKWKLVDSDSKKANMDINWMFRKEQVAKIRIINDANTPHPMQHPIHIHGQRFLVVDVNGVPTTNLVYKDTVLVQKGQTVDILVPMDNPGNWVIHCHIPEHMESGMMMKYHVI